MGITIPPRHDTCYICKHYTGVKVVDRQSNIEGLHINTCEAFPNGIPDEITYGNIDHKRSFHGDNGIIFELKNESTSSG